MHACNRISKSEEKERGENVSTDDAGMAHRRREEARTRARIIMINVMVRR